MPHFYTQSVADVSGQLDVDPERGLTSEQAAARLTEQGPNELVQMGGRSPWRILWEQLSGAMVVLLLVAVVVSLVLHEYVDAVVILAIVLINAVLGFVQDYRAEKALAALKKLSVPIVRVRRDGVVLELSARDLVPGDIVLLEVGNYVPADCRVCESVNLRIQESALTGESEAVQKVGEPLDSDNLALGDRTNMAFMGTVVTYGHGQAIVTATGMSTELGHIASSLQTVDTEQTPLQEKLAQLGRTLAFIAIGIVALVFALGLLQGEDTKLMLMTALSMAVAVVPEGLPAVATVALALGARRMFRRKALIRKLPAVETLGSVTVICSDKTGTLTENRMTVAVVDIAGARIDVDDSMTSNELKSKDADDSALALLLLGAGLCNDAELEWNPNEKQFRAVGDPTESALAIVAARAGLLKDSLRNVLPRCGEIPFDSDRKRMTTVHECDHLNECDESIAAALQPLIELDGQCIALTKGAVDSLVDVCPYVWEDGQPKSMNDTWKQRIASGLEQMAAGGMRVLGVAFRPLDQAPGDGGEDQAEQQLIFVGMLGMLDPPRKEVADAVERCRTAGIRPIMITGDHPLTASHIAAQLQISDDGQVLTGRDLDLVENESLPEIVANVSVFARVAPKHKLRLVKALQQSGQVVAMTGDGVNDAPALKQAHIGVAMGITGTDVSKEASQMVLLDDNFSTIVGAVEEGRIVYDNIRKFVKYTLTSNAGELWVMVIGPLLGMPLPLLPLQILWVNLVTDGMPGLALAVEKAERETMNRPPHPPEEHIFGRGMGRDIAWIGLLMGVVSLSMGYWYWADGSTSESHWRTMVFTVLTISQMGNAMTTRSTCDSLFQIGVFSNRLMIGSVALTFALQLSVIYWAPLQNIFKTTALSAGELATCVLLSAIVFWAVEAQKLLMRRRESQRAASV